MDLIEVYVVRAVVFQAGLNIPGHALPVTAHRLGRQDKLVPAALNGLADQLLADAVAPGGVDEIDARSFHRVQELSRRLRIDALDRDAPQTHPGDLQPGFSQCKVFHILFLLQNFR